MAMSGADQSRAPAQMRGALREYADEVKTLVGEDAASLTLFGAVLSPSFDVGRQAARSVLVVGRVDLSVLRRLGKQGLRFGKAGLAAPLIMTSAYIQASRDTFPLELIEIQQQHEVVFGEDYFTDLVFDDSHVRLQCERELKATLIGLRQGLLAAAGREKIVGALEMDAAAGLMRTLRGMLWLKGHKDALDQTKVISEIETLVSRKLVGVRAALDPTAHHGWSEFDSLYSDVEALGDLVDAW